MIYNTAGTMFRRAVRLLREKGQMQYEQRKADRPAEIRLYTLPKWFRKMAYQAGFENVEFWMGHTGPGVDANYRPTDPEFYRKIYTDKALPFLRLEAASPSESQKAIEELRQENAELKTRINLLEKGHSEVSDVANLALRLMKRIEELEKHLPSEKT